MERSPLCPNFGYYFIITYFGSYKVFFGSVFTIVFILSASKVEVTEIEINIVYGGPFGIP